MKMFLISDNIDTYTGMRLAGVEGVVVHEREELRKALEDAIANKENGIILLTEKFGREFPDIIDDMRLNHRLPLARYSAEKLRSVSARACRISLNLSAAYRRY